MSKTNYLQAVISDLQRTAGPYRCARALNRCAIARCGMRLVRGRNDQVEIIDSGGGALS
jgi:hypothetical protein